MKHLYLLVIVKIVYGDNGDGNIIVLVAVNYGGGDWYVLW